MTSEQGTSLDSVCAAVVVSMDYTSVDVLLGNFSRW